MQNEKDVIAGLQRGDPAAVEAAVDAIWIMHYTALKNFGTRFSKSKEDIEDIISDTFEAFLKKLSDFESYDHMKGFLFVTFRNKFLNLLKFNDRTAATYKTLYERTTDEAADEERNTQIENFLCKLPGFLETLSPRGRQVWDLMMNEENLSSQQIADRLSISVDNVYTVKSTIIKDLKNMLDQERGPDNDSMTLFIQGLILLISINY